MTIGSLFDGSGGFPLAFSLCGFTPVWASEIEAYPIRVTKKNFPHMAHLGDITKINGAGIEPVDVITFGSPCQDLSVAGKRGGLDGERSGLFLEAIRIIKEMRTATNGVYPKFIVWENVPGAYSSNRGNDFKTVLQEIAAIAGYEGKLYRPAKGWANAGAVMGGSFSIAFRTMDAALWGVPQRRRRIFLVADFAGERAGKVLFERDGLHGDFAAGGAAWQGAAPHAGGGAAAAGFDVRQITSPQCRATVAAGAPQPTLSKDGRPCVVCAGFKWHQGDNAGSIGWQEETAPTLDTLKAPAVCWDARGNGGNGIAPTMTGDHNGAISDYTTICMATQQGGAEIGVDLCPTLSCNHEQPIVARTSVRRLTPLECCRLQGFPDWWCDGVEGSDAAQYKMWGNGIALPCALYVAQGIKVEIERGRMEKG